MPSRDTYGQDRAAVALFAYCNKKQLNEFVDLVTPRKLRDGETRMPDLAVNMLKTAAVRLDGG